jgi:hypothetical protein
MKSIKNILSKKYKIFTKLKSNWRASSITNYFINLYWLKKIIIL